MTKRGASLLLDIIMFVAFLALMSWRLTGVALHEWLGVALIATIVAHLLIHWAWVESRVADARRGAQRSRLVPLLLNAALFLAMGTALVSGIEVSKVALPNQLAPGAYLKWHGLHDASSNAALILLGLHVALNWDRIRSGLRRRAGAARAGLPAWRVPALTSARRLAWILGLSTALAIAVRLGGTLLPDAGRVMMIYRDGRRELRPPPPEITGLQSGANRPDPSRGAARVAVSLFVLSLVAVAGRRVLKLRLSGRAGPASAPPLNGRQQIA